MKKLIIFLFCFQSFTAHASEYQLWYFYFPGCKYCKDMKSHIEEAANKTNITLIGISGHKKYRLGFKNDMYSNKPWKSLKVINAPTLYLINVKQKKFIMVSEGAILNTNDLITAIESAREKNA